MRAIKVALVGGAAVLALAGPASATTITVGNIQFTPVGDTSEGGFMNFIWSATAGGETSVDLLTVGAEVSFTYGTFSTNAFPISIGEQSDVDSLSVVVHVSAPGTPEYNIIGAGQVRSALALVGEPVNAQDVATVTFNSVYVPLGFGSTGVYQVRLDDFVLRQVGTGSFATGNLTGTMMLLQADVIGVVPEPATLALAGAGLVSAVLGRSKARRA